MRASHRAWGELLHLLWSGSRVALPELYLPAAADGTLLPRLRRSRRLAGQRERTDVASTFSGRRTATALPCRDTATLPTRPARSRAGRRPRARGGHRPDPPAGAAPPQATPPSCGRRCPRHGGRAGGRRLARPPGTSARLVAPHGPADVRIERGRSVATGVSGAGRAGEHRGRVRATDGAPGALHRRRRTAGTRDSLDASSRARIAAACEARAGGDGTPAGEGRRGARIDAAG